VVVFIVAGLFFASLNRSWQRATGQLPAVNWPATGGARKWWWWWRSEH